MSQLISKLLSKTISEILYGGPQSKFHIPFIVGVEIEAEGKNLPEHVNGNWRLVSEGSLRSGYEYVLKMPLLIDKVQFALKQWEEIVQISKTEFFDSLRTSTHIHLNVLPLSYHDVIKVVVASWIVESALVHMNGPNRVGNLFCLRLQDAEHLGEEFVGDIDNFFETEGSTAFLHSGDPHNRYAALNLAAIRKFGSLEYRFMKGMYTKGELWKWAEALHSLASKAIEFPTVTAIADAAISMPPSLFLKSLFPAPFATEIMDNADGHLRDFLDANQHVIRRVCEALYKHRFIRPVVSKDEDIKYERLGKIVNVLKGRATYQFTAGGAIPTPFPTTFPQPPTPTPGGWANDWVDPLVQPQQPQQPQTPTPEQIQQWLGALTDPPVIQTEGDNNG